MGPLITGGSRQIYLKYQRLKNSGFSFCYSDYFYLHIHICFNRQRWGETMQRLALLTIICLLTVFGHATCFGGEDATGMVGSTMDGKAGSSHNQAGDFWIEPSTGMEFVWVPGGCFQMGTPEGGTFTNAHKEELSLADENVFITILKGAVAFLPVGCSSAMRTSVPQDFNLYTKDERPVHEVCLDGYWMGKYEVTQGQWIKVMGNNPSYFKLGDDYPVEQVSWNDIMEFIKKINDGSSMTFSLPTEAQWEYAARSGGKNETFSGSNNADEVAWYYESSGGKTHQVGTKAANMLGIFDMSGNVREWCMDKYDRDAYSKHANHNPKYESKEESRVVRGGSWFMNPCDLRCASRGWDWASHPNTDVGFRLVRR
jgi:formylglycine-generating enzyme required for sulfatase activity